MTDDSSSASGNSLPAKNSFAAAPPAIPDYELVRIVGRGSYGDVWLARSVTGAWRAIKVVWRGRFSDPEPFEREFRGLKEFAEASLGESIQMALLHVGRNDAAGFFYYVMELADDAERGRAFEPADYVPLTLAELRVRRGRIAAADCTRIGSELARVLGGLHRRGLVHRDIKPPNIIMVGGLPKLADVGLVAPAASARTFVGTEGYVPPEGPGSPAADTYALGKVLYELSTGLDRQEFPKLPADLAQFTDRAALLELNEVVVRACGPTAELRYRDGAAMLADLEALGAGVSLRTRRFAAFALRIAAGVVMAAALGLGGWLWQTRPAPPPAPMVAGVSPYSVAVLPFVNATGDAAQDDYSDGLSDEIRRALERERDLHVTGSQSSFAFKDRKATSVEIAQALRVAQMVEGSLQRFGPLVRLEVRLTRGADGVSENLGTFEREEREMFALEEDVTRAVAQKILPRVTMPVLRVATETPAAYRAFLRGRAAQLRGVGEAGVAAKHLKEAVELDPDFAVAWARLSDALRTQGQSRVHGAWSDTGGALAAVNRALELQPDLALAWTVRGFVRGLSQRVPADGLFDLARAEELGGPTAETRMTRFLLTWFNGEPRALLTVAREAIALDPENLERRTVMTLAFWYLGDFAEADRLYCRHWPGEPRAYDHANDFVARVYLRRAWRGAEAALRLAERSPNEEGALEMRVRMLAALGKSAEAAALLAGVTAPLSCEVYAAAGLHERARARALATLPDLLKKFSDFPAVPRNDGEGQRREEARSLLIAAEIALGHREVALERLDAWWREAKQRATNRRSGGLYIVDLPRYYAELGKPENALAVLQQFREDGRSLGYDLRDTSSYAALRNDPLFLELRQNAEAWAAMQPDPSDYRVRSMRR